MNYRHAFHAGNFADCFKHALLVALIDALRRKATPFAVLDTHAGSGQYDLDSDAARRTNEAESGIRRLLAAEPPELARYLELIQVPGLYPGSPVIVRALLRPTDRLVCCERHPEEYAALRRLFRNDRQVEPHERSGWEAMAALLPPKEKRGLVFIDPPFEDREEFAALTAALRTGHARFGHGMFAAWYPVKQRAAVTLFHADMKDSGIRDIVAVEMLLRDPTSPEKLNGCGMLVINPPYMFESEGAAIARAVLDGLGMREPGAGVRVIRLADE